MYYFCAPVQKLPQLAIVQVEILGRILRLPVHACFEMQMRCRGTSCLAYECYYLASLHALPLLHQILRVVGVIGLKPVGMPDAHQIAVAGEFVGVDHLARESCVDLILVLCLEVGAGMHPSAPLAEWADNLGARQWEVPVARIGYIAGIVSVGAAGNQHTQDE